MTWTPDPSGIRDNEMNEATIIQSPYNSFVLFKVPEISAQNAEIKIFDLNGKMLFQSYNYIDNGEGRFFAMPQSILPIGMYVYQIENGSTMFSGKFFKSNH